MRKFISLVRSKNLTLFIFKAAILAFGALLCPPDWVIRQQMSRMTLPNSTCQGFLFFFFFFHNQFTSQITKRKEKKNELNHVWKVLLNSEVVSVYPSSLLSLLVQEYRNGPLCFFWTLWVCSTLLCSALCAPVKHDRKSICLHWFSQITRCGGAQRGHCMHFTSHLQPGVCYACSLPYHVHLRRVYLAKHALVTARFTIINNLP